MGEIAAVDVSTPALPGPSPTTTTIGALSTSSQIVTTTQSIPKFDRFDVVTDDTDHFYSNEAKSRDHKTDPFTNVSSSVHKKIMEEWKILSKNLPDSILVRVYENRIDLLRAVIIGANGTPYQDFLFFFDIVFPPGYPSIPPKAYYKSFGYRLNPNLYQSGKVCLSLLNTWTGKKDEKWDPNNSNIFQLLLSIQALVLNEKPFYNEPGYTKGRWEKSSNKYSEDAFLICCKSALCLLRNPPKNFESFVRDHFRERGIQILAACDAYKKGLVKVGRYVELGSSRSISSNSSQWKVSRKFKTAIERMYPQLAVAMLGNDSVLVKELSMSSSVTVVRQDGKTKQDAGDQELGKTKKIGFVEKLKMIFAGMKKNKKQNKKVLLDGHGNVPISSGVR